jgi:hypothetical protein
MRCFIGTGLTAAVVFFGACSAASFIQHPYPKSAVDMAISLKVGDIRTPEFSVVATDYQIWIQADGVLPARQMLCMMGMYSTPLAYKSFGCGSDDPLLRTDWELREGGLVVAHGSSPPDGHEIINNETKIKVIGYFSGQAGKKYSVQVRFSKDASALDAANPHLIIVPRKYRR